MAKPVYILISESASIDKTTNRCSHFNVMEGIQITVEHRSLPNDADPAQRLLIPFQPVEFSAAAVWVRDDENDSGEYEYRVMFKRPDDDHEVAGPSGRFSFDNRLYRLMVQTSLGPRPNQVAGDFVFKCGIRKIGSEQPWLEQSYVVPISVVIVDKDAELKGSNNTGD